jgi:steroid delta-isomerase-like uncharacterized protein
MSEENKALDRRVIEEGYNKHNLALLDEVLADCVWYRPETGELKGEALKQFLASVYTAFPDIRFTIQDQVAEGDKLVTRWSATGTHKGEFMGLAPTGKQMTTSGMTSSRIVEGKYVEVRQEWDALGFLQQLGAVPQATEANKALMRRWIEEGHNNRNLSVADELYDPAFVWHLTPVGEIRGTEALKQLIKSVHTAFPDWHITVEELVAESDKVMTHWRATGTHQGEFMGVAPTGQQVTTSGIIIGRIAGGEFVEAWEVWDALGLMQQLGAAPPLGKAKDKAAA